MRPCTSTESCTAYLPISSVAPCTCPGRKPPPASHTLKQSRWCPRPFLPSRVGVRPNSVAHTMIVSSSMPRCFKSLISAAVDQSSGDEALPGKVGSRSLGRPVQTVQTSDVLWFLGQIKRFGCRLLHLESRLEGTDSSRQRRVVRTLAEMLLVQGVDQIEFQVLQLLTRTRRLQVGDRVVAGEDAG